MAISLPPHWILPGMSIAEVTHVRHAIGEIDTSLVHDHEPMLPVEIVDAWCMAQAQKPWKTAITATGDAADEPAVLIACTKYVLAKLGTMLIAMPCTATICPLMVATKDWEFLCAHPMHREPKKCPAIDYALHTLAHMSAVVAALTTTTDAHTVKKEVSNGMRRIYRIFAHNYHHHQTEFLAWEEKNQLYRIFVSFSLDNDLLKRTMMEPKIPLYS